MANKSLFMLKALWITFMVFWMVVFVLVLLDPSVTTTRPAFGLDPYASTIFAASLCILVYMEVKLALRYQARKSNIVAILWFTFLAFSFTIGFSLVAELYVSVQFVPVINNFLNRTIFVFTVLGFLNLVFFIVEVFEGGLNFPHEMAKQPRNEFLRVWLTILMSLGLVCVFMYYLVRSIWVDLDATESIVQIAPVLIIAMVDMFALLVQPIKLIRRTVDPHEKAGLTALFLAGVCFFCFIIFYAAHTISISGNPAELQYYMRGSMYYLAMSFVVVVCALFYLGIV